MQETVNQFLDFAKTNNKTENISALEVNSRLTFLISIMKNI